MIACLISIGNELTGGQTVDTNSAWLARRLTESGVQCLRHVTIADELAPIRDAILVASREADLVLITGGLGPTPDDLTREALAAALNVPLEPHEESLKWIAAYFESRRREMHPANRRQAMLPKGATALDNPQGTAPGMRVTLNRADIFAMPGVPYEMKAMFERHVRPILNAGRTEQIREHTLRTTGMSESEVGERLTDLMQRGRNPTIGTSADEMIITIRIVAQGAPDECDRLIQSDLREIRNRLGDCVFGEMDATLEASVGDLLRARNQTISTVESCTGGLIAKRLTDVPGSSAWVMQALITYSNESKTRLVGVPADLIGQQGAVSEAVAVAMAQNGRTRAGTDYTLAVTGIAGPSGGTADKPIGLVYVALATPSTTITRELRLGDNLTRRQIRDRTAKAALNLLRLTLLRT